MSVMVYEPDEDGGIPRRARLYFMSARCAERAALWHAEEGEVQGAFESALRARHKRVYGVMSMLKWLCAAPPPTPVQTPEPPPPATTVTIGGHLYVPPEAVWNWLSGGYEVPE